MDTCTFAQNGINPGVRCKTCNEVTSSAGSGCEQCDSSKGYARNSDRTECVRCGKDFFADSATGSCKACGAGLCSSDGVTCKECGAPVAPSPPAESSGGGFFSQPWYYLALEAIFTAAVGAATLKLMTKKGRAQAYSIGKGAANRLGFRDSKAVRLGILARMNGQNPSLMTAEQAADRLQVNPVPNAPISQSADMEFSNPLVVNIGRQNSVQEWGNQRAEFPT
jgi:hypothetical protein